MKDKNRTKKESVKINGFQAPRVETLMKEHSHEVSPWRIFKIMAEFVAGYEFLRRYKKAVTIFGSARETLPKEVYDEAEKLAHGLSKMGFAVITGGGGGIMQAANKGAFKAKGSSVGINIRLPYEQRSNEYVTESEAFKYFFVRKTMLSYASQLYIFFPGGFGTLDELFEMLTLVQTEKIEKIPIILVGREFCAPLLKWIDECLNKHHNLIDSHDMNLYRLVDNADEALDIVKTLAKSKK